MPLSKADARSYLRSTVSFVIVSVVGALGAGACGDERVDPGAPSFVGPDGGRASSADGGAAGAQIGCAADNEDVFVLSADRSFHRFAPASLKFTKVGELACPTGGAGPTSMAVDRAGIAWVRHTDGSVWKVDTRDLACEPTPFDARSAPFLKFGMGFSSDVRGGSAETLFVSDSYGEGLGIIDRTTHELRAVGPFTGALAGASAELTGTGEGRLFGLFVTRPMQIGEIDKKTGSVTDAKTLKDTLSGDAWAFSFHGGDFYVYTHAPPAADAPPMGGGGSRVTRFRPKDGSVTIVKEDVGFTIVGAGVSTCAPVDSPR